MSASQNVESIFKINAHITSDAFKFIGSNALRGAHKVTSGATAPVREPNTHKLHSKLIAAISTHNAAT